MIRLYKSNMMRLFKNYFFLGGCAIALVLTLMTVKHKLDSVFVFLKGGSPEGIMFFMSAAMVAFFTIFTVIYTNTEYSNGVIRNKITAGFSQTQIYLSHLLTHISAALIMCVFYVLGGVIGGARYKAYYFKANIAFMLALFAYIAVINLIAMRLKNVVVAIVLAMAVLNISFNMVLFGNLVVTALKGKALFIGAVIYNISALGQWFVYTGFADEEVNPGFLVQLALSVIIFVLVTLIGLIKINKRDLA